MKVDLIVHNIGQLVTCASGGRPKRGAEMSEIGVIEDAAVAVSNGRIAAIGTSNEILRDHHCGELIDAGGRAACPGFVDPHTHIVYAGDRLDEFELKIKGAEYLDILKAGGGILSTVTMTRNASLDDLVESSLGRLGKMLACGTTTCEIKTGYGLDPASEMKMLEVIEAVAGAQTVEIVPTFLAAHAVPREFAQAPDAYVDLICREMLQKAWRWYVQSPFHGAVPFYCDVFCESGAFTLAQSRKILEAAKSLGFRLKAHVDEFSNLGGSRLGIALKAASIDHLDTISDDEVRSLASSDTVAVVTPTVNFNFGGSKFADARKLIDAGCVVALATDFNPGSAPCPSQPMTMAIACRYQKLTPAEALVAATINAAHAIGLGDRTGSIEIGKQADILLLDTHDIRDLAYEFGGDLVGSVFKKGVRVC